MMSWLDDLPDDEFESHQRALDDVLDAHLGPAPDDEQSKDAEFVMMALWLPAGGLGALNPSQEIAKLQKIRKLASELANEWNQINYQTRSLMEMLSKSVYAAKNQNSSFRSANPLNLDILSVLDAVLAETLPAAQSHIDCSPVSGRRNLQSLRTIGLIERLRTVWGERQGHAAPRSMNETGRFADYIRACFDALEITASPRAAVDAWRAFRDSYPISD